MIYQYRCEVFNVVDGDTVDCVVDLGFRVKLSMRVRLWGINAPERGTPEAVTASSYLRYRVIKKPLMVQTLMDKEDKYGRMLGIFFENGDERSVNQKMLDDKQAVPYLVTLQDGRLPEVS